MNELGGRAARCRLPDGAGAGAIAGSAVRSRFRPWRLRRHPRRNRSAGLCRDRHWDSRHCCCQRCDRYQRADCQGPLSVLVVMVLTRSKLGSVHSDRFEAVQYRCNPTWDSERSVSASSVVRQPSPYLLTTTWNSLNGVKMGWVTCGGGLVVDAHLNCGEARRPFFVRSPRYISSMVCVPAAQALPAEELRVVPPKGLRG